MYKFIIEGRKKLKGETEVSGSKNAALPIISASLLIDDEVLLKNVPKISDVMTMIKVIRHIGGKAEWVGDDLIIDSRDISSYEILDQDLTKMRATILFLSSILSRFKRVKLNYPGGCVIGKRPIDSHIFVLNKLGANITIDQDVIVAKAKKLIGNKIVMPEFSVTATENAIIASVMAKDDTTIKLAATEPHIQDLCEFLVKAGAHIEGIGTHTLKIKGVDKLHSLEYSVTPDYLEAGTMILAGVITKGYILVKNVREDHLDTFFNNLKIVGANFKIYDNKVEILPPKNNYIALRKIESRIYPGFPTDLQPPFSVLLTQAKGVSKVFETLFENRLAYLFELEKMGAKIEMLNPHQAIIIGGSKLIGTSVASLDIRAGASMVLAGLIAEGSTEITGINYIDRGYYKLEDKLSSLGARIKRIPTDI